MTTRSMILLTKPFFLLCFVCCFFLFYFDSYLAKTMSIAKFKANECDDEKLINNMTKSVYNQL